jgi:hypothetical protein
MGSLKNRDKEELLAAAWDELVEIRSVGALSRTGVKKTC